MLKFAGKKCLIYIQCLSLSPLSLMGLTTHVYFMHNYLFMHNELSSRLRFDFSVSSSSPLQTATSTTITPSLIYR